MLLQTSAIMHYQKCMLLLPTIYYSRGNETKLFNKISLFLYIRYCVRYEACTTENHHSRHCCGLWNGTAICFTSWTHQQILVLNGTVNWGVRRMYSNMQHEVGVPYSGSVQACVTGTLRNWN